MIRLGRVLGKPLFWIKFDEIRDALAKNEVYMFNNDAQRISSMISLCNDGLGVSFTVSQMFTMTG